MFERDSLKVLEERTTANYMSLFRPLDKSTRYNLVKVMAKVDAGTHHQMRGDLDFLSKQIFPDTAEGEYLRAHWSSRVPPLYAVAAIGTVIVTGTPGLAIPTGVVFSSAVGKRYYTAQSYHIGEDGTVEVNVKAEEAGIDSNIEAGQNVTIASSVPSGVNSNAVTGANGILGGSDSESDEEYLSRVLTALRNPSKYGKRGDYSMWALDSTPEVSAAWEFKNFSTFGALLIMVINGNQTDGVFPVDNLQAVIDYISTVSPPIIFTVRTPELIQLDPEVSLLPNEDSAENRELAISRMKNYLQQTAEPGVTITAGALRISIIDGIAITDAVVRLNGDVVGHVDTTILQYPILGDVLWV